MRSYKAINNQIFINGIYKIVPIRDEDKFDIMNWRNDQIYHLRQKHLLTNQSQTNYFKNIVSTLFEQEYPDQILFSFLEENICVGYGGLVHINWTDKNAEISFVLKTSLEYKFVEMWKIFLQLIEIVGFYELDFHKLYTYAFDLRPKLYIALEQSGYVKEALLSQHTCFNGNFINVVIHSKLKINHYFLRPAESNFDSLVLFEWANEISVRKNSFNQSEISIAEHFKWFYAKIIDPESKIFILTDSFNSLIGQIRIDKVLDFYEIDYSISLDFRGKGMGNIIIQLIQKTVVGNHLKARVKKTNLPSINIFSKNGFEIESETKELIVFTKFVDHE